MTIDWYLRIGGEAVWLRNLHGVFFRDCDLNDPFFDSLKSDYEEFPQWFWKKAQAGEEALVFKDDKGIAAFVYLKSECEEIKLKEKTLPVINRIKIGTLRIAERLRNQRLGEGAIGVALWRWQESTFDEIYVTVFEKHRLLIELFERFGFSFVGTNERGERVYLKSRKGIDYSSPYKAFPFINPNFGKAGLIPIEDYYHDKLFPYSELYGNKNKVEEIAAGNGITKVYIATPYSSLQFTPQQPVFIYRKYNGKGSKTFKSVITSFCVIHKVEIIKSEKIPLVKFDEFVEKAGNKTVYTEKELKDIYYSKRNIVILEMTYNGYFGKGNNITHKELYDAGLWFDTHPYNFVYSKKQFIDILRRGGKDDKNIIVN